jgi:hypothetical protein
MTFGLHPSPWGFAPGCHSVFDHSVSPSVTCYSLWTPVVVSANIHPVSMHFAHPSE